MALAVATIVAKVMSWVLRAERAVAWPAPPEAGQSRGMRFRLIARQPCGFWTTVAGGQDAAIVSCPPLRIGQTLLCCLKLLQKFLPSKTMLPRITRPDP